MYCSAKNTVHGKPTYSSVVAAWDAGQKDTGSNLLIFLTLLFISNWKDIGSNPVNTVNL